MSIYQAGALIQIDAWHIHATAQGAQENKHFIADAFDGEKEIRVGAQHALSSEFQNYAHYTEFVADVGMLRRKYDHCLKADTISKLTVLSHFLQNHFSHAKNQILA